MKSLLPVRVALTLAGSLVLGVVLILTLYVTEVGFSVWERLQQAPVWFWIIYCAAITLVAGAGVYLIWQIWRLLGPKPPKPDSGAKSAIPTSEPELLERLERSAGQGVAVDEVRRELQELQRRRDAGEIAVAIFGEVSTGKSSLIRALLPGADTEIDVLAGTTRRVRHYTWTSPAGDRLVLADLPGLNEADRTLDEEARLEAQRAHVVVYVCDGDLTRDQFSMLRGVQELGKPVVVALNKTDHYRDDELDRVRTRIAERVGQGVDVVAIQSGGTEQVLRVHPDGREEQIERPRRPRVDALRDSLQRHIDADPDALEKLRDTAVFVLAHQRLDSAVGAHRRQSADSLIEGYSRKAVFGALAAVGPGTDLLIQGYLGVNMIKELCALYEVEAQEIDLQRFLNLAGGQVKRNLNLLLALVGNIFKAFPGVGTVVGGMLHAVAYGLIFESLGRSVVQSLETRGDLSVGPALRMFEDNLGENLEARARRLARLVIAGQSKHVG